MIFTYFYHTNYSYLNLLSLFYGYLYYISRVFTLYGPTFWIASRVQIWFRFQRFAYFVLNGCRIYREISAAMNHSRSPPGLLSLGSGLPICSGAIPSGWQCAFLVPSDHTPIERLSPFVFRAKLSTPNILFTIPAGSYSLPYCFNSVQVCFNICMTYYI